MSRVVTSSAWFAGGSTGDLYVRNFKRNQPAWDAIVASVASHGAPPRRVLDLASGPGEPARSLAVAFPKASIVATDVEPGMVAKQASYLEGLPNVEASRVVAGEDLSAFGDASFDVATSCNGVMYLDRPRAFAELFRVLDSAGRLVVTFWRDHKISTLAKELIELLDREKDLGPHLLNPSSCGAVGVLEADLQAAGFQVVERVDGAYDFGPYPSFDDLYSGAILTFEAAVNKAGLESAAKEDLMRLAKAKLHDIADARYVTADGSYCIPGNAFSLIHAVKPPAP